MDPRGTGAAPPAVSVARPALYLAFLLSGAAGLTYELVWSRYLALLLGHSAYAQILVIAVYLGGMAAGSLLIGQRSAAIRRPLRWYAGAEALLAAFGLGFHALYLAGSRLSYEVLFPALAGTDLLGSVKVLAAVLLILPQAVVLGTTFPLMAAGILRTLRLGAGRTIADVYLWNTLGGALGVLLAGFVLVAWVGLPGSSVGAGLGNLAAGALALAVSMRLREGEGESGDRVRAAGGSTTPAPATAGGRSVDGGGEPEDVGEDRNGLWRFLLQVSFLTAVASFCYEVAWIRMLSLVLGSATHAFELMLSAFILGLALGSWWIRRHADASRRPVTLLALIQWAMGFAALATLPVYVLSFEVMAGLLESVPRTGAGYALFNLGRYGLALAVMLPSTMLAGMTLPLITGTLLRTRLGERSIGWVYGVNTVGSVVGVLLAALLLLPALGLEGLLVAGASLDMAVGVAVLARARRVGRRGTPDGGGRPAGALGRRLAGRSAPALLGGLSAAVAVGVLAGVRLDRSLLTSGVFRFGRLPAEGAREVRFYRDGRTSSVSVHEEGTGPLVVLSTNGKPDASLPAAWIAAAGGAPSAPVTLRSADAATQLLAPLVTLAHRPGARTAAVIGHGSGMSAQALLGTPGLERVVTVEIEPAMVEGSLLFLPANERVFRDARSHFVFEDARAYFAAAGERYDVIFSEPSNPWVSGVSSLFTEEFYRDVRRYLAEGGVFGQWLQLYEMSDGLALTALSALHRVFPSYSVYLVGNGDVLIVAGTGPEALAPDWSVFDHPGVRQTTAHIHPFTPEHLGALWMFERRDVAPVLDAWPHVNSDFHPLLDLGAERDRFYRRFAWGLFSLAVTRFDLLGTLRGERRGRPAYRPVPVWGLGPMRLSAQAAWLGSEGRDPDAAPPYPEWRAPHLAYHGFMRELSTDRLLDDWRSFAARFSRVERDLHDQTAGFADSAFYGAVRRYLDRVDAPAEVRSVVDFHHGLAAWDFAEAAGAAEVLLRSPTDSLWVEAVELIDGAVVGFVKTGRPTEALDAIERLEPFTGRRPDDLRRSLLAALARRAAER